MAQHKMNRREAFAAGAAGALSMSATSNVAAADSAKQTPLTIGVATTNFRELTNAQLAQELARSDIKVIQLFLTQTDSRYWVYNGRSDVSDLTAERCKAIADTYRSVGITIHSIGVYTNLIHPDPSERQANLAYFESMMKIARQMDVDTLITESGHYHAEGPAPRIEYHFQEDVWRMAVSTGKQLAKLAERHEVTVLFEPFFRGLLASAKRTRLFLEEIGSPHINALLDPANLLELNDLEEMFQQLKPWIKCLHAKDRKLHVAHGVAAGQGDVDYRKFVKLAAEHTPQAPLVLEYVGVQDYKQAITHLRSAIQQTGLSYR